MKKGIAKSLFVSLPIILLGFLHTAHAEPIFKLSNLATKTDPQQEIFLIIQYLLALAFPFVVGGLIIGGFLYVTSAGNEPRAERAKSAITYSIVGLVVILLAFVIVSTLNTVLIH